MNMKMKMKNNKTMLALVLVAALALCSVGVVAAADDSDAAGTPVAGGLTITSETKDSYDVYGSSSTVTIKDDANYTGTVQFGTYEIKLGQTVYTFTPEVTLELSGVSGGKITYNGTTATISGTVAGEVNITLGSITLGADAAGFFNGIVEGNTLTLASTNTAGTVLTAGTVDKITSTGVIKGDDVDADKKVIDAELLIGGTGLIGNFTNTSAEITIADGATITSDLASTERYTVENTTVIAKINTNATIIYGMATAPNGDKYTLASTSGSIKYTTVANNVNSTMFTDLTYDIIIVTSEDSKANIYSGTLSFTVAAGTTDSAKKTITPVLTANNGASAITVVDGDIKALAVGGNDVPKALSPVANDATLATGQIKVDSTNSTTTLDVYSDVDTKYVAVNLTSGVGATFTSGKFVFDSAFTTGDTIFISCADAGTATFYFLGTVNTTAKTLTAVTTAPTKLVVDSNLTLVSGEIYYSGKTITYYSDDVVKAAYNMTTGQTGVAVNGVITFASGISNGDKIIVLSTNKAGTTNYIGEITATTDCSKVSVTNAIGFGTAVNQIMYDSGNYDYVYASIGTTPATANDKDAKTITFGTGNISGNLFVLLKNADGNFVAYYGVATVATNVVTALAKTALIGNLTLGINSEDAVPAKNITPGPKSNEATLTPVSQLVTLTNSSTGTLNVDGTLTMNYSSETIKSVITNSGTINVDGKIVYQVAAKTTIIAATINAAYYVTGTTAPFTFTYTTLKTAMENSSDITVIGKLVIEEDMTLTGNSSATPVANKITFATGAEIEIGVVAVDATETTPAVLPKVAVVTIPTTTTIVYSNGFFDVQNGQLRIDSTTSPVDLGTSKVLAAVFMKETVDNGFVAVYTDLATAVGLASGTATIELRQDADINKDATVTVKEGITVDGKGLYALDINNGAKFTVDGELKGISALNVKAGSEVTLNGKFTTTGTITVDAAQKATAVLKAYAAGILNINCAKDNITLAPTSFTMNGVLNFGANSEVSTLTAIITTGTEAAPAKINFNGKFTTSANIGGGYVTVTVSGTLAMTGTSVFSGNVTLTVTGTFTGVAATAVDYLTVTGTGSVSTTAAMTVNKKMISGTAATKLATNANGTTVTVTLGSSAIAIVYGTPAESKVVISNESAKKTAFMLGDVLYSTQYGASANAVKVDLTAPSLEGIKFNGWYNAPTNGVIITDNSGVDVGDYANVYGYTATQTFNVTLSATQNGHWIVNGVDIGASGIVAVPYGSATIEFVADNGYTLKDYSVLVNDKDMPANYQPAEGDKITFAGTVEKNTENGGMDLVTILLIIITIVIIIMAIIIALKLLRS